MGYCPFQSGPMFDASGNFIQMYKEPCPESTDCQLWDSINKKCGTKVTNTLADSSSEQNVLITMLETVLGAQSEKDNNNSLVKYFTDILGSHSEKEEAPNGESLLKIINHIHDSHKHADDHKCNKIPAKCGKSSGGGQSSMSAASTLMQEFQGNQDQDDNGKVYGYDFRIKTTDNKPHILDTIEQSPQWQEPETAIEWNEYITWYKDPHTNPDPLNGE